MSALRQGPFFVKNMFFRCRRSRSVFFEKYGFSVSALPQGPFFSQQIQFFGVGAPAGAFFSSQIRFSVSVLQQGPFFPQTYVYPYQWVLWHPLCSVKKGAHLKYWKKYVLQVVGSLPKYSTKNEKYSEGDPSSICCTTAWILFKKILI